MARPPFSSVTIGGAMVAEGVDHIRKGRECLERATALMNAVAAGGASPALLEASTEFNVTAVPAIPAATIVSSSVANPSVLTTSTAHGIPTGYTATISGHTGSTPDINGSRIVTSTGANTLTIPLNVTVGGTGGTITAVVAGVNGKLFYDAVNDMKTNAATVTDAAIADIDMGS
jgi:hypothetical protein